jgi:hypothetical protein
MEPGDLEALLAQNGFKRLKTQRCIVNEDVFILWVVQ